jgi:protein tyrosine/serine phosphatase
LALLGILVLAVAVLCQVRTRRDEAGIISANKPGDARPEAIAKRGWARRLELPGTPNLHKVSEHLYRGAQPSAEGMRQLKKLGVKTVVNLRSFHSDQDEIGDTALAYEHIYMKTWHPEDKEVVRFLQIVTDPNRVPVFVHCQRGADRTGTMCAIYRIAVEGWSKREAVEEMTRGGFGFFSGWQGLVDYIRKLDVEQTKKRAGLEE